MRASTRELAFAAAALSWMTLQPQAGLSQNEVRNTPAIAEADKDFLTVAAEIAAHELQLGKAGVERGTNGDLKMYAQALVDDYTLATAEIEALARLKGVALPNPPKPDPAVAQLSQLYGLEFDQAFVRQSISDQAKIVGIFEKEEQTPGADMDIQGFTKSLLPKIRTHLQQARNLKL